MITHRGTIFGTSLKKEEFFEKQIRHLSFRKGFKNYGHEIEMYTVEQGEKRDKRQ